MYTTLVPVSASISTLQQPNTYFCSYSTSLNCSSYSAPITPNACFCCSSTDMQSLFPLLPATDFGILPTLEYGDLRLTQSKTIARFLAKKTGLYGDSDEAQARADMAVDFLVDHFDSKERSEFAFILFGNRPHIDSRQWKAGRQEGRIDICKNMKK